MNMLWIFLTFCASFIEGSTVCPGARSNEFLKSLTWSSWGPCTNNCGGGIKSRTGTCTYYHSYYSYNGMYWARSQTRMRSLSNSTSCNKICFHGKYYNQQCQCLPGIKGRCCEVVPVCKPACENGGTCIADSTCTCQQGFYGQWCEIGGDFDKKLKPRLNTTLPLSNSNQLMSWYDAPDTSDYNRACYIKLHFTDAAHDTLVTAKSHVVADESQQFGTFTAGPIDVKGQLNDTSRFSCVQVKCPGSSLNGTRIDVSVSVSVSSRYKACIVRKHATNLSGFTQNNASSFELQLKNGENYGSSFGIYFGMGFRDMANYIARQSCLSGRRFDLLHLNPSVNTLADFMCV